MKELYGIWMSHFIFVIHAPTQNHCDAAWDLQSKIAQRINVVHCIRIRLDYGHGQRLHVGPMGDYLPTSESASQDPGLPQLYDSQTSNVTGTFTRKNTARVFVYVMPNLRLGVIVIGIWDCGACNVMYSVTEPRTAFHICRLPISAAQHSGWAQSLWIRNLNNLWYVFIYFLLNWHSTLN